MACTTPTPVAMFYAQFAPLPSKMQGFLDFLECIQWSVGRVGKRLEEVMDHRTCFGRVSQVVSCKWHEPMLGPKESSNDCKANPKLNSADIHPKQKHDRTICASKRVHPKPSYAKTNVSSRRNAHFRKSTLHHSAA